MSTPDVVQALGLPANFVATARQIQYKRAKVGRPLLGSTTFEFTHEAELLQVFRALSVDGMKTDLDGFVQKQCSLPANRFPTAQPFWVKVYFTPSAPELQAPGSIAAAAVAAPQVVV